MVLVFAVGDAPKDSSTALLSSQSKKYVWFTLYVNMLVTLDCELRTT